jgi:hypothetical protein
LYGLSCFEKIPVANQEERGARMKSVGLLAVGYSDLHLHMDFLQRQVRYGGMLGTKVILTLFYF